MGLHEISEESTEKQLKAQEIEKILKVREEKVKRLRRRCPYPVKLVMAKGKKTEETGGTFSS